MFIFVLDSDECMQRPGNLILGKYNWGMFVVTQENYPLSLVAGLELFSFGTNNFMQEDWRNKKKL